MIPERVRKLLLSRQVEDRISAVEELAGISPPESTPFLLEMLRDRSHYVAALAARVLGEQGDRAAAWPMIERFEWLAADGKERDPGCRIRNELAVALGKLEDHRAADVLLAGVRTIQVEPDGPGFSDMATGLRGNCALALAQIRPPGTLLALSLLLFDIVEVDGRYQKVDPCRVAAQALQHLGDPAGVGPLAIRLAGGIGPGVSEPWLHTLPAAVPPPNRSETEPDLLASCMEAIVELDPDEAVKLLAPHLRDVARKAEEDIARGFGRGTRAYLCASAALALARTRRPEVLALLRECLETAPDDALQPVAIALAGVRSPDARGALIEAAGHTRAAVRAAAMPALAFFPDDEVMALLRRMAEDDGDAAVRRAAAEAVG